MLKKKILNKEKTIGMYIQLTDVSTARIAGMAGYDFIWIDTEHSFMSFETLFSQIIAVRQTNTPVIVRLPQDDLTATKKILEMGVDGVIFPMVKTADEINRLIASTLYPPFGNRGFGPMNAVDYGFKDAFEYTKEDHKKLCRFVQIESKEMLENLDEIMENEFIDGYIFGANDLSGSYNMLGEAFSDKITDVIKNAVIKLRSKGKYVGIASGGTSEKVLSHWAGFEPDMLTAGADFDFIRDGAVANRKNLEKLFKLK